MSKAEHESTTSRNLEKILIDRNGALTAALVRIRALAAERRTDRDMAFLFQTAEDAIATAGAPVGTTGDEDLIALCAAAMALKDKLDGHEHSWSEDETEKEWEKLWEMDERIGETPAVSTAGLFAKLQFANSYADDMATGECIWRSAAADAERLAGKGGPT
jgi:hypothetical protein